MAEMEELLDRLKNLSMSYCRNRETQNSESSDVCPICHGNEWILVMGEDGIERARPCECRERAIMSRRLLFAELPESLRDKTLKTFRVDIYREEKSRETARAACRIAKEYLGDFEKQKEAGMGLYIWSYTKGSGKTRLAAGIVNELLLKYPVKFAVSMAILQEIKDSWRKDSRNTESRLIDELSAVEILVIDDFGVETPAGWINDKFYQIINERYLKRKVTIFTSNEPLEKVPYDERITSRIKEMVYQISFPEESVREHISAQKSKSLIEEIMKK